MIGTCYQRFSAADKPDNCVACTNEYSRCFKLITVYNITCNNVVAFDTYINTDS